MPSANCCRFTDLCGPDKAKLATLMKSTAAANIANEALTKSLAKENLANTSLSSEVKTLRTRFTQSLNVVKSYQTKMLQMADSDKEQVKEIRTLKARVEASSSSAILPPPPPPPPTSDASLIYAEETLSQALQQVEALKVENSRLGANLRTKEFEIEELDLTNSDLKKKMHEHVKRIEVAQLEVLEKQKAEVSLLRSKLLEVESSKELERVRAELFERRLEDSVKEKEQKIAMAKVAPQKVDRGTTVQVDAGTETPVIEPGIETAAVVAVTELAEESISNSNSNSNDMTNTSLGDASTWLSFVRERSSSLSNVPPHQPHQRPTTHDDENDSQLMKQVASGANKLSQDLDHVLSDINEMEVKNGVIDGGIRTGQPEAQAFAHAQAQSERAQLNAKTSHMSLAEQLTNGFMNLNSNNGVDITEEYEKEKEEEEEQQEFEDDKENTTTTTTTTTIQQPPKKNSHMQRILAIQEESWSPSSKTTKKLSNANAADSMLMVRSRVDASSNNNNNNNNSSTYSNNDSLLQTRYGPSSSAKAQLAHAKSLSKPRHVRPKLTKANPKPRRRSTMNDSDLVNFHDDENLDDVNTSVDSTFYDETLFDVLDQLDQL